MSDYDYRFGGIGRLYGTKALEKLKNSHIAVIGIGGIGTWVVEALARTGVGKLTLVDLDDVCITNVNRQVHAHDGQIGHQKTQAMAKRIKLINPECDIECLEDFFTEKTAENILSQNYDYVVDCIDSTFNKCLLAVLCKEKSIPLIICGGAGGKSDPTQIKVSDLSQTKNDRLLKRMKKILRQKHNFPREGKGKFNIDTVYSSEKQVYPNENGEVCDRKDPNSSAKMDCYTGLGSASFMTGSIGFFAAAIVVKKLSIDS
jgi:tRNA A37 threonylcarbamoyladenosine dehydratase